MTKQERLEIYESFFHQINLYCTVMKSDKIREAVGLIDSWSYAHRAGNGCLSWDEQQEMIEDVIKQMRDFK